MEPRAPFTALDWIAVALTVIVAVSLAALVPVGMSFRAMYADFGSEAPLPILTQLTTSVFGPPALAIPSLAILGLALRVRAIGLRRAGVVCAFVLALAAFALCWVGDYMPLWQLAAAIHE